MKSRVLLALLSAGALSLLVAAGGEEPKPLATTGIDFKAKSDTWFKAPKDDEKGRKDQMKEASRALKRPCKYCHVEDDFEKFVDEDQIGRAHV